MAARAGSGIGGRSTPVRGARSAMSEASTVLTVAEVAEQSGFASVHYLSRLFRQETGLTPTAYRRQFCGRPATELR